MCGIVGYVGKRAISDVLLSGLKKLEYRGYDSSGMAVSQNDKIEIFKAVGKVSKLRELVEKEFNESSDCERIKSGISHTRWATHGLPSEKNAHPHTDEHFKFALVHNGIVENYAVLKKQLQSKGHRFNSDTDTEIIAHLISECYDGDFLKAVAAALKQITGTYGIAIISEFHPNTIIAARNGSPVVIGIGDDEVFVSSDISAIVSYTRKVIYLDDGDIAVIENNKVDIRNIDIVQVERELKHIDWDTNLVEKNGYPHFMLKEIFEQPDSLKNTIRGRLNVGEGNSILSGLSYSPRDLIAVSNIIIVACGTSFNAGLVGEYFFEDISGIPTEVAQAAEFRYRNPIIGPNTLVLAISQSGETADTLAAVKEAKNKGAIVTSICNVVGSTIARETGMGVYLHAGPEIGVASTKAFLCQVTILLMMALKFGRVKRYSLQDGVALVKNILNLPDMLKIVLKESSNIELVSKKYANFKNMFFIGRGYLFPVALEGALKLKEISYIHAEGYHAAELKHGPIALLDENLPVVVLANKISGREKIIGNIQECKARNAKVIAIATVGDKEIEGMVDDVLWVADTPIYLTPILVTVVLQLFAYYIAKERGCDIDQPRNLAKSVTVE